MLGATGTARAQLAPRDENSAGSFSPYHWSISTSSTDPQANTGIPTGGPESVYLWLCRVGDVGVPPCVLVDGVSSAQFGLLASGDVVIEDVIPFEGISNLGSTTRPLFVLPDCSGPTLVAKISILSLPGGICLVPCGDADGAPVKGVEDCAEPGVFRSIDWTGLDLGSGPCGKGYLGCFGHIDSWGACCLPDGSCVMGEACDCILQGGEPRGFGSSCETEECDPVATEPTTWGRTKSRYRE